MKRFLHFVVIFYFLNLSQTLHVVTDKHISWDQFYPAQELSNRQKEIHATGLRHSRMQTCIICIVSGAMEPHGKASQPVIQFIDWPEKMTVCCILKEIWQKGKNQEERFG